MRFAWLLLLSTCAFAQPSETNVIYGMYSGAALLLDVWRPAQPNGYGVVYISGSGFRAPQDYGAQPLKDNDQTRLYARRLSQAGYTVFAITHRAAPRFRYPAAVDDAQRAVRFVRYNAAKYGIQPDRIGAAGGSSGGHLVLMLGVLDGRADSQAVDPADRVSAKVQCVVARAPVTDLTLMSRSGGAGASVAWMGMQGPAANEHNTVEARAYAQASPLTHVSPDDPPIFLMHGDADTTVPYEQSVLMEKALRSAGVPTGLLRVPGGGHGPEFPGASNPPDYMGAMIQWLDRHLRGIGN